MRRMIRQRWAHLWWVARLLGRRGRALHVLQSWVSLVGYGETARQLKHAESNDWARAILITTMTTGRVSPEVLACIEEFPEVPYV